MIFLQNELLEQRGFGDVKLSGFFAVMQWWWCLIVAPGSVDRTGLQQGGEEEIPCLRLPLGVRVEICNYT